MDAFYGRTGLLETIQSITINEATAEYREKVVQRWGCDKDEEESTIAGFKKGYNGLLVSGEPEITKMGRWREIKVTFGPAKRPQKMGWYTSTADGPVWNEQELTTIDGTISVAMAASMPNRGLKGNGMSCTPQQGLMYVLCNSSWGPNPAEDAEDKEPTNANIFDDISVSGGTGSMAVNKFNSVLRTGEAFTARQIGVVEQIASGAVRYKDDEYAIQDQRNKWVQGGEYQLGDNMVIPNFEFDSDTGYKAATYITDTKPVAYANTTIQIAYAKWNKNKRASVEDLMKLSEKTGRLYRQIKVCGVTIPAPQISNAELQTYDSKSATGPGGGGAKSLQKVERLWKFNGPQAKVFPERSRTTAEKQEDGSTKTVKEYRWKLSVSFTSVAEISVYYNGSDYNEYLEIYDSFDIEGGIGDDVLEEK